jgi:hypothetical protein
MNYQCPFCDGPVDPNSDLTFQGMHGWSKPRRRGQQAGSDIVLREPLDEFAHGACVLKTKMNIDPGQLTLSDAS